MGWTKQQYCMLMIWLCHSANSDHTASAIHLYFLMLSLHRLCSNHLQVARCMNTQIANSNRAHRDRLHKNVRKFLFWVSVRQMQPCFTESGVEVNEAQANLSLMWWETHNVFPTKNWHVSNNRTHQPCRLTEESTRLSEKNRPTLS